MATYHEQAVIEFLRDPANAHYLEEKSFDTLVKYHTRGYRLIARYFNSLYPKELRSKKGEIREWKTELKELAANPQPFLESREAKKKDLRSVSHRQERASLRFWFTVRGLPEMAELIGQISSQGCRTRRNPSPRGAQTSAKKLKWISPQMALALISALAKLEIPYGGLAAMWIYFGVLLGLRPIEWFEARLVPATSTEKAYLWVRNAKFGKNRAHGTHRKLVLENWRATDLELLLRFLRQLPSLQNGKEMQEFKRVYQRCATLVRDTGKKLWPRRKQRPTLYSCRHQFMANAKLANLSKIEIAALVGHATDETSSMCYARRQKGAPGYFRVSAHPDDMARVRQVYEAPDFELIELRRSDGNSFAIADENFTGEQMGDSTIDEWDSSVSRDMWELVRDEPNWDSINGVGEDEESAEPDGESPKIKKSEDDFSPG